MVEAFEVDNVIGGADGSISVSHSYELTWTDADVSASNDTFYEGLNDSIAAIAFRYVHEQEIRVHRTANVRFTCTIPENPDNTSIQAYKAVARWTAKRNDFPELYAQPDDVGTLTGTIPAGWKIFDINPTDP